MWFRLASAEWQTGKHLGAMDVLANAWSVGYNVSGGITKTSGSGSISKGGTLTATFTLSTGATFTSATLTPASAGTVTHTVSSSIVTITIKNVSANCTLSVVATGGSVEPETPTNYTFTINPNPTSATVTLSATGYTTVSGTGSKSISVASGTVVSYNVSASGYTSQSGTQTVTSTSTKNISLSESSSSSGTTVKLFNDNRTIVNSIADMSFTAKLALSNTNALTNVTGRASDHTHALAATAGQTVTLSQPISGVTLTYALVCFNSSGATCSKEKNFLAQAWISSSVTLPTNTAYVMIAFKRGDGTSDFSSSELAQLTSALTFA